MLLHNQVAVIYGATGAIGSAVARAFAREGATVHLTGRRAAPLQQLAAEITASGGRAEAAEVDAMDEAAITQHLQAAVAASGRLDIAFNAVGVPEAEILGQPLADIEIERFLRPLNDYARTYLLTARAAARHMLPQRSGVIMNVTALPARLGTPLNGGYGPAMAAKEAMTRDLSSALAPSGIRVVGLRPHGMPDTPMMKELHRIKAPAMGGISWEQFQAYLANMGHAKRVMRVDELAQVAAFAASPQASALLGTTLNLTLGSLDD